MQARTREVASRIGYGALVLVVIAAIFWLSPARTLVLGDASLSAQLSRIPGLSAASPLGRQIDSYDNEIEKLRAAGADETAVQRATEALEEVRGYLAHLGELKRVDGAGEWFVTEETVQTKLYSRVDPHMIAARKSIGLKPGERL